MLRHGDECRRLYRNGHVRLAGHYRDERRNKEYKAGDRHLADVPPTGRSFGGKLEMERRPVKVAKARPSAWVGKAIARASWVATFGVFR